MLKHYKNSVFFSFYIKRDFDIFHDRLSSMSDRNEHKKDHSYIVLVCCAGVVVCCVAYMCSACSGVKRSI